MREDLEVPINIFLFLVLMGAVLVTVFIAGDQLIMGARIHRACEKALEGDIMYMCAVGCKDVGLENATFIPESQGSGLSLPGVNLTAGWEYVNLTP